MTEPIDISALIPVNHGAEYLGKLFNFAQNSSIAWRDIRTCVLRT